MPAEHLLRAFHGYTEFRFERAPVRSVSAFGGPMEPRVGGGPYGPRPLHMIARLGWLHVPALTQSLNELPLIYGMSYSDCRMRYRVGPGGIELLQLTPRESSDDWPYPDFPPLLPYLPLRLSDVPRSASYTDFVGALGHRNLPDAQPAELVVVVPPPASIGVSLWGRRDGEDAMIVFECDLRNKEVSAYNVTR